MSKLQQLIEAAKAATPGPWEWIDPMHDLPWGGTGFASLRTVKQYGKNKTELRDGLHYTSFALPKFVCDADSLESVEDATFIALANPATILELCALLEKAEEALTLLHKSVPSLRCDSFHHAKGDQHDVEETCPPLARYCYAEYRTNEAIAAIKQWKEQA